MFSGINMNRLVGGSKVVVAGSKKPTGAGKRKAEVSPRKMEPSLKKRSALGDLTNAVKKKGAGTTNKDKDKIEKVLEKAEIKMTRARSKSTFVLEESEPEPPVAKAKQVEVVSKHSESDVAKNKQAVKQEEKISNFVHPSKLPVRQTRASRSRVSDQENHDTESENKEVKVTRHRMSTRSSILKEQQQPSSSAETSTSSSADCTQASVEEDDSVLYSTAISSPDNSTSIFNENVEEQNRKNEEISKKLESKIPDGVIDFDAEAGNDPYQVGIYAEDIFAYYMRRELRFPVRKYLEKQTELNRNMRSILVDWMVEVQESFELNHETMYLAVKLVDLFLSKVQVKREKLQLVGTTALYISAKFDERSPPVIDDFCYICDDAYPQRDVHKMEIKMLRTLNYDVGVPLSYRFLRRYSRCAKLNMETLTLARYILEMCLMEYDFIDARDSMMAASSLLLALKMKGVEQPWSKTLEHYSGYKVSDLFDLTHRIHAYLSAVPSHLKTIRSKYSHKVFYESAKVPLMDELNL